MKTDTCCCCLEKNERNLSIRIRCTETYLIRDIRAISTYVDIPNNWSSTKSLKGVSDIQARYVMLTRSVDNFWCEVSSNICDLNLITTSNEYKCFDSAVASSSSRTYLICISFKDWPPPVVVGMTLLQRSLRVKKWAIPGLFFFIFVF